MRDEQKRIQSYRDNKKLEQLIRVYKNNKGIKNLFKGDRLIQFESFVSQVEDTIPIEILEQLNIFDKNNPTLAKELGISQNIIRRKKEYIRNQFKPIIEANKDILELFI